MRKLLIASLSAGLAALSFPAHAAPTPPALAGTITLTGNQTAVMSVVLKRPAILRDPSRAAGAANDVRVMGSGFAGFVLRRTDNTLTFVGGRQPSDARTFVSQVQGPEPAAEQWPVPAGEYTLYLLAPRPSAKVTFRLLGLPGSATLRPTATRALDFAAPAPQIDTPGAHFLFGVGRDVTQKRTSLFFSYMTVTQPLLTEMHHSSCFYFSRPVGPTPYAPGCPAASQLTSSGFAIVSDENTESQRIGFTSGLTDIKPGTYGAGMGFVSASPASEVHYEQMWLDQ